MEVLILPVSGGGFVSQLACLTHLCQVNYRPTVTFASSGGNVAAYIASAATWHWAGIERIAEDLSHDLFIRPRHAISFLSGLIGFFEGNVYQRGVGVEQFFHKHFTAETISNDEIWTGTYNKSRCRAGLFCNQPLANSHLNLQTLNLDLVQAMAPVYVTGPTAIARLAVIASASASVPAVVEGQIIDGDYHIDGGLGGASPFTLLASTLRDHPGPLHLTYVNSIDLSDTLESTTINAFDTVRRTAEGLVRVGIRDERLRAHELIAQRASVSQPLQYSTFDCSYDNLRAARQTIAQSSASLLEICPRGWEDEERMVNLLQFNGRDVVNKMLHVYPQCYCKLWTVPSGEKIPARP